MGDLVIYKLWVNQAAYQGIHRAYVAPEYHYDWLPLYLYVCKLAGVFYYASGMATTFGPYSSALSLILKGVMIAANLVTTAFVYLLSERLFRSRAGAWWAGAAFAMNPAIAVATDVFGYQDAAHTALILIAAYCFCAQRQGWMAAAATLSLLTKPQAAIFLPALAVAVCVRSGIRGLAKSVAVGVSVTVVALLPFIRKDAMGGVLRMFAGVANVHEWLSGCAHNIWWLVARGPPFASDRLPLVAGLRGLPIGLALLSAFSLAVLYRLWRRPSNTMLVHSCALLGFGFYMLPTEMHENYYYALFPFLSVFVCASGRLRAIYIALCITCTANVVLTGCLLQAGWLVELGPVRLSVLNAAANLAIFGVWARWAFAAGEAGGVPGPDPRDGP